MTKAIGGDVIEAAAHPDLLAPGTVRRPPWISEADWARMPWPAQWRAVRAGMPEAVRAELQRRAEQRAAAQRQVANLTCIVELRPCGTHAAFNRHRVAGEEPCPACWMAEREYQTARGRRRRAARAAS